MLQKIERVLFDIFIFSVPFQTRFIFGYWFPRAALAIPLKNHMFNEWTSGYIYASDIFLLAVLAIWLCGYLRRIDGYALHFSRSDSVLAAFVVLSFLSLIHSANIALGVFRFLKLIEWSVLYLYIRHRAFSVVTMRTGLVFLCAALANAAVGILQFIVQHSLGLPFVAESPLDVYRAGVATFVVHGQRILRAYGMTPHPNVLAVVLSTATILIWALYVSGAMTKRVSQIMLVIYPMLLWALLLTFSRTILFITFCSFGLFVWLVCHRVQVPYMKIRLKYLLCATVGIGLVLCFVYSPLIINRMRISSDEEAYVQRKNFNSLAVSETQKYPLRGLGVGQFVSHLLIEFKGYPLNTYQPVHNVYLLIASETGIASLLIFIVFIGSHVRTWLYARSRNHIYHYALILELSGLLFLAFFDHLWWTLQQGSLIFWIVLGLLAVHSHVEGSVL